MHAIRELSVDILPNTGEIQEKDLINLALAQCTQDCIQQASKLIAQAVPEMGFEKKINRNKYTVTH